MIRFDLRFPPEVREVLADLARSISEDAPAAILAHACPPEDEDPDFGDQWLAGLHTGIDEDTAGAVALFENKDFGTAPVELDEHAAFAALRGFTALRLTLRETALRGLPDESLETGKVDRRKLTAAQRHAYACYGALGEIQVALCEMLGAR